MKTLANLDRTIAENEKLIVRAAGYNIPESPMSQCFALDCLYSVLGGKMGADAYYPLVSDMRGFHIDRGYAEASERMYREITSY